MTSPTSSAYDLMLAALRQWGLEQLAPDVLRLLQDGYSQDQVSILIQDTAAYKKRFAGNDERRRVGLPALSPAEYLSVETSYRRILEGNGLPAGFYDSPDDFAGWIGRDVAPTEIERRVGYAVDAAQRVDEGTKWAFRQYYGIDPPQLAAFFLDQDRAMPIIEKQAKAARIGASAYNQNVQGGWSQAYAERLATSTLVAQDDIEGAVSGAAEAGRDVGLLGQLYGDRDYSAATAAEEVFFADTAAKRRRQKLIQRETAEFGGASGVGRGSLAEDTGRY